MEEEHCIDQVSNSFHGARSIRGHSTSQECLRKIILMLSRSSHAKQTLTAHGIGGLDGYTHGRLGGQDPIIQNCPEQRGMQIQECPEKHSVQKLEAVENFFLFLPSKEEEEKERRRGHGVSSNSRPDDGLALRLGLPVNSEQEQIRDVSGTSQSNLCCSNNIAEEPRRDLGKYWWEYEASYEHARSAGRQWYLGNNNSSVESENLSVFQRSSEGECDPKNDVSFPAQDVSEIGNSGENAVDDDSKLDLNECNGKDVGLVSDETDISAKDGTQARDMKQSTEPQEEEDKEEEYAHMPTCSNSDRDGFKDQNGSQKEYSEQCNEVDESKEECHGSLDLLVDAINLASGALFETQEKKGNVDIKKKRAKKHLSSSCKRKRIPAAGGDKGRKDKPSFSVSSTQQDENSVQGSETICGNSKNYENCLLNWYADYEDTGPLIRSKRGRNQALPSRFRDSVLDPWKRVTRPRLKNLN